MRLFKYRTTNVNRMGYSFILPNLIVMLILITYPVFRGLYISLFNTNLINKWKFVGLNNYTNVLFNSEFYSSVWITLKFTFFVVLGHFIIGFILSHILNKDIKGITLFRAILIMPWLIPESVLAMVFKWLFNPVYGLVNHLLMKLSIISEPLSWLGDGKYAFFIAVMVCIWKGFPMIMMMILAGLQSIPKTLYEAGQIDGASNWQKFIYITIPSIKHILTTALILDTVWWFKHYTIVWVLTQGGPGSATSLISIDIYKTNFEYFKFGKGSATAILVFFICFAIGKIYERVFKANED